MRPRWASFAAMSSPTDKTAPTSQLEQFEKSLDELETLVNRMEQGELSLDESLQSFERGIALYRNCQSALEQAELKVQQLLSLDPNETAQPFEPGTP